MTEYAKTVLDRRFDQYVRKRAIRGHSLQDFANEQ